MLGGSVDNNLLLLSLTTLQVPEITLGVLCFAFISEATGLLDTEPSAMKMTGLRLTFLFETQLVVVVFGSWGCREVSSLPARYVMLAGCEKSPAVAKCKRCSHIMTPRAVETRSLRGHVELSVNVTCVSVRN